MGRKKKKKNVVPRKKCCNFCTSMSFDKKTGDVICNHPETGIGEKENCKNFRHDFSCDFYTEIESEDEPADHPVIATFKEAEEPPDCLQYLEELKDKEVDIFFSGSMYTGQIVGYNIASITFVRTYNGERMMIPISEVEIHVPDN
jgi:hypothetical protein